MTVIVALMTLFARVDGNGEELELFQIPVVIAGMPLSLIGDLLTGASDRAQHQLALTAILMMIVP
jgi:hypothetical protein